MGLPVLRIDFFAVTLGDDHKDIRSFLAATVNPHAVEAVSGVLRPQREMERAKAYAARPGVQALHREMASLPRCAQHGTVSVQWKFCIDYVFDKLVAAQLLM